MRPLAFLLLLPGLVLAQELHTFENGQVADAEKINENFQALADGLGTLSSVPTIGGLDNGYIEVDCSVNADALSNVMFSEAALRINSMTVFVLAGNCNYPGNQWLRSRSVGLIAAEQGMELIFTTEQKFLNIKNGDLYLEGFTLRDVQTISLFQQASLQVASVSFKHSSEMFPPRINVRSNSLLRISEAFESVEPFVRPSIYATNSEVRILNVDTTAVMGTIDLALNSTFWCRFCRLDAEALKLDTNSSFCGFVESLDGNPEELGIQSLSVKAGSVFLHDWAPTSPPSYPATVDEDAFAVWDNASPAYSTRCFQR